MTEETVVPMPHPRQSLRRASSQLQLQDELQPRTAAAEAAAAAALVVLQNWTAWAVLTAAAEAASNEEPGSQAQLQLFAEMAHEAIAATINVRTMWNAWEQLDTAVTNWAQLARLPKRQA